jgi:Ulp1 family protease
MNHIISSICKDNIPIHDSTSSTAFSIPNLVQCKEHNENFAIMQKWSHGLDLLFIDYIVIPINHNEH